MKTLIALGLGLTLAGCTGAQPDPARRDTYTVCIDNRGASRPAVCRGGASTRLSEERGLCLCADSLNDAIQVPLCRDGQRPPVESRDYERARLAASRDGSLVGDTFEGQAMCVLPRTERRTIF